MKSDRPRENTLKNMITDVLNQKTGNTHIQRVFRFWGILREAFQNWREDRASRLAAALAYYTLFSIAPLLVIVISIVGFVFGPDAARGQIFNEVARVTGQQAAEALQWLIQTVNTPSSGLAATLVSSALLFFGAANVFQQLKDSLNIIWGIMPKSEGLRGLLRSRFPAFALVVLSGLILIGSIIFSLIVSTILEILRGQFPIFETLNGVLQLPITFAVMMFILAAFYKILPDAHIRWKDVWFGAAVTAGLFVFGRYLIELYLTQRIVTSAYGIAGSLVVILLWVYYSAQIFFFGAEVSYVYAHRYGSFKEVPLPPKYAAFSAIQVVSPGSGGVPGAKAPALDDIPEKAPGNQNGIQPVLSSSSLEKEN